MRWMMWRESFTSPYLLSALKVYRALRHVPKPFDIADGGVHAAHGLLAEALVANASPAAARDVRNLLGGGTSTIVDDDVSVDGVVRTSTHVGIVCGVDDVASTITCPTLLSYSTSSSAASSSSSDIQTLRFLRSAKGHPGRAYKHKRSSGSRNVSERLLNVQTDGC